MIDIVSWPSRFAVEPRKITRYLLDRDSEDGAAKARYLESYGSSLSRSEELNDALMAHAALSRFAGMMVTPYGLKLRFNGAMPAPNGRDATALTVWQVDAFSDGAARFVTLVPGSR